ncbi:ATP-binding protein, partial [Desulfobacterales bacterium HSG16]|nr:ATP-binding protein [Desulfobacterales bacterium HSG16]
IAILIFFFISRSIVAPVNYLVNAANKVAKGSLEFRVKPGRLPETRELSIAFNAMLDSIQKSRTELDAVNKEMIKQKTLAEVGKFSLMIAHEFKNPMSIIKSSVDILKKDLNPIPASGAKMIEFIEGEIVRLNRLVEDFLTFAKPTNPVFRRVDVNAMLNENLVRFDIQTSAYSIEIQSDISKDLHYAKIDPDLIGRVFDNILRNAFEANEHKNTIYIRAFSENKRWVVEIEDEGCGILPENIDKIFEPFFTTRSTGTGLGLAFSSQVVKAHGGCLAAKNKSDGGRGAIFRVELQLCENENPSDEYKNG